MLVCIKALWFQAGWFTFGEDQRFQLKTKLWIVLLRVNVTEISNSGGVFCAKTFLSICHMLGLFPHLQISGIWVNLVITAVQKFPKCCCCCWTETINIARKHQRLYSRLILKLTTSWLRKPQYGPEKKVIQQNLFKPRSCWLSESPGVVKNTCQDKIQCD